MKPSHLRSRYIRILAFFVGVIARFILWEIVIRFIGLRGWVRRTRTERFRREAVRFRALAIRMGRILRLSWRLTRRGAYRNDSTGRNHGSSKADSRRVGPVAL